VFAAQPAEHWVQLCFELGIPTSLVCDISEVAQQEHAAAREMIVDTGVENVRSAGIPIKMSRTPGTLRTPPPGPGADNQRILAPLTNGSSTGASTLFQRARVIFRLPNTTSVSRNFSVTQGLTRSVTIRAHQRTAVSLSDLGVPQADWPVITMIDTGANQDACQSATLRLTYSGIEAAG